MDTPTKSFITNLPNHHTRRQHNPNMQTEGQKAQHMLCVEEQCFLNPALLQPLQCFVKMDDILNPSFKETPKSTTATILVANLSESWLMACGRYITSEASLSQHVLCTKKYCFVGPSLILPTNCKVSLEKLYL